MTRARAMRLHITQARGMGSIGGGEGAYRRESPVVRRDLLRLCQMSLMNKVG